MPNQGFYVPTIMIMLKQKEMGKRDGVPVWGEEEKEEGEAKEARWQPKRGGGVNTRRQRGKEAEKTPKKGQRIGDLIAPTLAPAQGRPRAPVVPLGGPHAAHNTAKGEKHGEIGGKEGNKGGKRKRFRIISRVWLRLRGTSEYMQHGYNSSVRQKGNVHEIRAHQLGNWGLLKNLIINALNA